MSIVINDYKQVNQNPVNNSSAKQLWSFPQGRRFSQITQDRYCQHVQYQKENTTFLKNRGIRFSQVKKYDICMKSDAPPVGSYQSQSSFKILNKMATQDSSRAGRMPGHQNKSQLSYNDSLIDVDLTRPGTSLNLRKQQTLNNNNTSPLTRTQYTNNTLAKNQSNLSQKINQNQSDTNFAYHTISDFKSGGFPSYTMGSKPKHTSLLHNMDPDIPNPDRYQEIYKIGITKEGRYPNSKFVNTSGYSFGVRTDTKINIRLTKPVNLGPASYDCDQKKAIRYLSNYRNKGNSVFPTQKRILLGDVSKDKQCSPGPGNYTLPSDFGNQIDKRYYMKQRQRLLSNNIIIVANDTALLNQDYGNGNAEYQNRKLLLNKDITI
eukprot:403361668